MSPELEEELVARYPLLFEIDRDWGSREISEHWAIRCGDGWYGLIDATCRVLHELTTRMFEQTRGALVWMPRVSFYVDPGERPDQGGLLRVDLFDRDHCPQPPYPEPGTVMTPATYVYQLSDGISWMATDASSVICEVCGNAGRYTNLRVRCDAHRDVSAADAATFSERAVNRLLLQCRPMDSEKHFVIRHHPKKRQRPRS
jgi:hypothetical protein